MKDGQSGTEYIIETIKEEVCDNLCKYPVQTDSDIWDEFQDEICGRCPLNLLDCLKED